MGKRGPRKQPTKLRILRGDPSKEGRHEGEPLPPAGPLEASPHLQGEALAMWNRRAPQLASMGVLTVADRETLERYCLTYDLWLEAYREVKANGLAASIGSGRRVGNPDVVALRGFAADLLKIEQEFGCTPSSRAGLVVNNATQKDEFEEFLRETS